jgi:amidohydrolase
MIDVDQIIKWRRYFHQHPETANEEIHTSQTVAKLLKSFGLDVKTDIGGYGVIAVIKGEKPGKTIALRADMDALPIQDEKSVPYRSTVPGKMHACGHDGHMSMLLGAAQYLVEHRHTIKGEVRFIFQPAEEVMPGGAVRMIEEGCLEGVDYIYGQHLWSGLPSGTIAISEGPIMGSSDFFNLTIEGKGGHAATPQLTIDPITISAQIINQLQMIVSRRISPMAPCVITVGSIHAGSTNNVIPDRAELKGTVRCLNNKLRDEIQELMDQTIEGICDSYGAEYKFEYIMGCPPVVNHKAAAGIMREAARKVVDEKEVIEKEPFMIGEDFSHYLTKVPGCFAFVGSGKSEKNSIYPHHHSLFDIDEEALEIGAKLLIAAVLEHSK